jgi:hypothetical protein
VEFAADLRRYRAGNGATFEKRLRDSFWVTDYWG